MLSDYENKRINKELKALVDEYQRSYEAAHLQSEARYKTTLPAGASFYPRKGFYNAEDRQRFAAKCQGYKDKAHSLIDKAAKEIMDQNTAAPSADAANVVAVVNARQNMSVEEIDQLMTRYGHDCPMVYRALYDKAYSLGYKDFIRHPIERVAENMDSLLKKIDRAFSADDRDTTDMVIHASAFNGYVDDAFPAGEE